MSRKQAARAAGRRRAAQPSARQRIFRTASELFYRQGIQAIGVETIAAEAGTTKMTLYRNFPSKDVLVAEWLRAHDATFWQGWDAMLQRYRDEPRQKLAAAFELLAKHVSDPRARGCPMANAAVEITRRSHPARKVIETHKAKLRARLAELCKEAGAPQPTHLADQLFLLMEGAQVSVILGVRGPAKNAGRAADALIRAHLGLGPQPAQRR
ncbi:MAG: TetR/AcrR family transcriptional regulator [Betaproteobacteria bacterium]